MAASRTASQTINELREFASFTAPEQFFIERALELGRADGRAHPGLPCIEGALPSCSRVEQAGYRELRALRGEMRADRPLAAIDGFFAALVRVTALDLARGAIGSFAAYRFLYERLLGAHVRGYLPASFCAAAALPQIEPARRTLLLASVEEIVVSTTAWSERQPVFIPCRVMD
jgi:hypothetical protein